MSSKKKTKKIKIEPTPEEREQLLKGFKIRPNSDLFFVTYFSNPKNEKVLVNLINSVLTDAKGHPIVSAEVLNPFNIKKFAIDKNMVLDVRARDERGWIFDIEIQITTHLAFKERMLGYWADAYSGQLFRSEDFVSLKPVVSIIIVFENIFPALKGRHQVFRLVSDENPNVSFSDHIAVHVLCFKGVHVDHQEKILDWNEDLQGWSLFLSCEPENLEDQMSVISKKNPVLGEVGAEFRRYSSDPEMREFERTRMLSDAFRRLELGTIMEQLEQAKQATKQAKQATQRAKKAKDKAEQAKDKAEQAKDKAEQAIVESEVKGKTDDAAKKVARLLEKRFEKVPRQITEALLKIDDLDKLDKLFDLAFDCKTLKEFQKATM